jgi:hypothetical protein
MDKPSIEPPIEIRIRWTRDFMKLRASRYLSRYPYRGHIIFSILVLLVGIAGLVFDHRKMYRFCWWLLVLVAMYPLIRFWGVYFLLRWPIRRSSLDRQMIARINPDYLEIDNGDIIWNMRWKVFKRLWIFPDVFLLFTNRPFPFMLPVSDLPEDARIFITTKIKEHGGEVA